jgi:hypothetical protein
MRASRTWRRWERRVCIGRAVRKCQRAAAVGNGDPCGAKPARRKQRGMNGKARNPSCRRSSTTSVHPRNQSSRHRPCCARRGARRAWTTSYERFDASRRAVPADLGASFTPSARRMTAPTGSTPVRGRALGCGVRRPAQRPFAERTWAPPAGWAYAFCAPRVSA